MVLQQIAVRMIITIGISVALISSWDICQLKTD